MKSGLFRRFLVSGILLITITLCANLTFAMADSSIISTTSGVANRQGRPDIHGNIITWKRLMDGASNWDIYYHDLSSPGTHIVTSSPGMQFNPVTNGTDVIWEDWTSGFSDIRMKNLFSGASEAPLVTGAGNQGILSVSGNTVLYVDGSSGQNNIYAVDIGNPSLISEIVSPAAAAYDQWQPRINGTKVVWQDNRNGNYDIYMKDLSTPGVPERQLTTDTGDDVAPDISGDVVVWKSHHDGRYDIRWMNVNDGIELPVTNDTPYQESAAVSGDLVVWMDFRNDTNPSDTYYDYDIYMKDLTSGAESMLAGGPSIQAYPRVDGEKVVWEEISTENSTYTTRIMMAQVPDTTAPVIAPVHPANGSATGCSSPLIGAGYSDNRAGIDTGRVTLTVDGQDVTGGATITANSISYPPGALEDGLHTVSLTVDDLSGNSASASWQFQTSRPMLGLSSQMSFWATYADYLNRELSVKYRISNSSSDADAMDLQILDSQATAGVIMASSAPINIGELLPGAQGDLIIRYLVPVNVGSFKTTLYASCLDTCGSAYYFPGPPPGL